jgi:hypothetical protein
MVKLRRRTTTELAASPTASMRFSPHSARRFLLVGAVVVAVAGLVLLVVVRPDDRAGPCVVAGDVASLPELPEASGLAVSRRHPGVLWSHNDSGGEPVLVAVDATGRVCGRVRVPVRARDWEDISAAPCDGGDCLYLADVGDNRLTRPRVQIHRLREPALGDTVTPVPETFTAVYPDGPHNAEAAFVVGAELFIVTRDRVAALYRSSVRGPDRELRLQRVGHLDLEAVTDAETSRDGASVAVRTSHDVVLYRADVLAGGRVAAYLRIPIDGLREPQGEGVALDGATLYLASEGRPWHRAGRLITLRCSLPD